MAQQRVGELLLHEGACTPQALRDALENQVIFGGRLGTNLLELRGVTEEALARALGRRHGVPALHGELRLDPEAVRLVRGDVADRYEVIPYVLADRRLAVLACDPSDLAMLDEVAFASGRQVHALVAPEARIWALLKRTYGIERQLRGIEVDFAPRRAAAPASPAAPAAAGAAGGGDLMDESEFDAIYGKTGSFALGPAPAPPPPVPDEEGVVDLLDLVIDEPPAPPPVAPEVLASLSTAGHAPPPRPRAPAAPPRPVEAPEPSPLGFGEALRFLEGVEERGAIARTVLRYARTHFKRALLLTVHHGVAQGWAGLGEKLSGERVARVRVPLGTPGVVDTVVRTRAHFLGPLPRTDANILLLKQLGGGVPGNAVLLPVLARGRVVNVLYGDAGRGGMVDASGVGELLILATRITQSYEQLLARVA